MYSVDHLGYGFDREKSTATVDDGGDTTAAEEGTETPSELRMMLGEEEGESAIINGLAREEEVVVDN